MDFAIPTPISLLLHKFLYAYYPSFFNHLQKVHCTSQGFSSDQKVYLPKFNFYVYYVFFIPSPTPPSD